MSIERDENRSMVMALAGCGLASLLAVGTAVALIRQHASPMAHIGDIISFNRPIGDYPMPTVVAQRAHGGTCVMDPALLANKGGSLIVEGAVEQGSPLYHVHWAGPPTSAPAEDCGRVADLLMDESSLDNLSAAAGGYGVDRKSLALTAPLPAMALAVN